MASDPLSAAIDEAVDKAVAKAFATQLAPLLARVRGGTAGKPDRRVVTVPEACRVYGIGRRALLDLVTTGRLPATTRRQRGGKNGYVLRVVDCERVIGGAS